MLSDPLVIPILTNPISAGDMALFEDLSDYVNDPAGPVDRVECRLLGAGLGSGKRKGSMTDGTQVTLSTSHSTSKENAPYVTDRSLARLDFSRVDATTGKPITASAYVVVALPQGATFTSADAKLFAESLALFVILGGKRAVPAPTASHYFDETDGDTIGHLIGGEA